MWAYVFGVVVLLLLWGALCRWALTAWFQRRALKAGQQLAYWALALLVAYALLMAVTEMLLPESALALQLGRTALQSAQSWSYGLGWCAVLLLFYQAIKTVYNKPELLRPYLKAMMGGRSKAPVKAVARKRRA